jgi:nicotinamidase/pyrazinamidase
MELDIRPTDALIIVDPQKDFCPGGALAVGGGDEVMPGIDELSSRFPMAVVTQDWHPAGHSSFASSHPGAAPFSLTTMPYGPQVLWPDHCIQGSVGSEFHPGISRAVQRAHLIIRKGYNPAIDSYSAFYENDKTTPTGLSGYLRDKGVRRCILVGLAYDFCVAYSALDARREGFEALVLKGLTRAIAMPVEGGGTTVNLMEAQFRERGVQLA